MTEYENPQGAARSQGDPGADVLDVLIRNLETAKATFEGGGKTFEEGKELAAAGPVFCVLFYVTPGQICPLYYYHSLTEPETEPVG